MQTLLASVLQTSYLSLTTSLYNALGSIALSDLLKLISLDEEDLTIVSAHVQDALVRADEIEYVPNRKQLILPIRRFVWEAPGARRMLFPNKERRAAVLHFNHVQALKVRGFRQGAPEALSLLTIEYAQNSENDPAGEIVLHFAERKAMALKVDAIEAQLTDTGGRWAASSRPKHPATSYPW